MCKNCYHRRGREKTAKNCDHTNRPLYAKGLCKPCYQTNYCKSKNMSNNFEYHDDNKEITFNKNQKNFSNLSKKNTKTFDREILLFEMV